MSKYGWDPLSVFLICYSTFLLGLAMFPFLPSTKAEQAEAEPKVKILYRVTLIDGKGEFRSWKTSENPRRHSNPSEVSFGDISIVGGTVLIERI